MTNATVSVVICAYTTARWAQLEAAAASAVHQTHPAVEVLVVIDHCDELMAQADRLPGVRVLANREARGLSGARNTGVGAATAQVVAFLDDDAFAEPTWLEEMVRHYEDLAVVGVGGKVLPEWRAGEPAWLPPEFRWVVGCSYTGQPEQTAAVRNPIGASMSFRRAPLVEVGGFSHTVGRIGTTPLGCEETELSIRLARRFPGSRILHEPRSVVHHHVAPERTRWAYYRRRCWGEGLSKAQVARLSDPRQALSAERRYVTTTLPRGIARDMHAGLQQGDPRRIQRAAASLAGLAITAAGYAVGRLNRPPTEHAEQIAQNKSHKQGRAMPNWTTDQLNFDVHGRLGIRVDPDSPASHQLRTMLGCFATQGEVPPDIIVSNRPEPMPDAALLEHELAYTQDAVRFMADRVQIVVDGDRYRIHGPGELLTTLVPVLDRAMVARGAAMIHAATMAYNGYGIALPAAGGTGKTSTVAKLMRREGWSFMGDDWAFLADDATLLGYEKPMFIKPHHKTIYPHLFAGAHKPLVPAGMSRSVGRFTTVVHPYVIRYPRLADFSRRWSPEHRMVDARKAFPGRTPTVSAPLAAAVYLERFEGARTRILERTSSWMVDRMLGNFHIEMAGFSQHVVTGLAATSVIPWTRHVEEKGNVLSKALDGRPCHLLQVPSVYTADEASEVIVTFLEELMPSVLPAGE